MTKIQAHTIGQMIGARLKCDPACKWYQGTKEEQATKWRVPAEHFETFVQSWEKMVNAT